VTTDDKKELTKTRIAILERRYGYERYALGDSEANDWFTWDSPDDPAPLFNGTGDYIGDTAQAIALIDKFIQTMGGRILPDSDTIISPGSIGRPSEATLKLTFYPPSLRKYLAQSEAQWSDKA
jgi:hypothetical protein